MKNIKTAEKNFKGKLLILALSAIIGGIIFATGASAATLTVDDSGEANYTKIQDAIDNATEGDTVLVYSGTYFENVNVNEQLTLRGVDTGEGKPIVNGGDYNAIELNADGITVEGFVLVKPDLTPYADGIHVNSHNNIIENNSVALNFANGIYLNISNNNILRNNVVSHGVVGILLLTSSKNTLTGNIATNNGNAFLIGAFSNDNIISGNTASSNGDGILLMNSHDNSIESNTVISGDRGISLSGSGNRIEGNTVNGNNYGFFLQNAINNTLKGNIAMKNINGIEVLGVSNGNIVYDNIFNNSNNFVLNAVSRWNITRVPGRNIAGGVDLGGNFWATPGVTGFSQTCADGDGDGICDSSYVLDSSNTDYMPLTYKPQTGELFDDFDDNAINPSLWGSWIMGSGPTISEINQRLEITLPANSTDDVNTSPPVFSSGYGSRCYLKGDFDVNADYELLDWPYSNGVRVGLGIAGGAVERISLGDPSWDFPGKPREAYLTHFEDGVYGFINTGDSSGKLRAVRNGNNLTGYYFGSGNWIPIHSYTPSATADSGFSLSSWSHNSIFMKKDVRVAFDNIVINKGKPICSDAIPPATAASLIGTAGQNDWYTSDMQVILVALDNAGGSGVARSEYSYDGINWNIYTAPITASAEGTTTLYYRSRDRAWNIEATKELAINIDKMPPVISGFVAAAPNANSWYNSSVLVRFLSSDAISGIGTATPDTTLSTEGASQSITGTAVDNAGNSARVTISGLNIDKTAPQVAIQSPVNGSEYILNQIVPASWNASDSLSGIDIATGTAPDGQPIDTALQGIRSFDVNAVDKAGNPRDQSVLYYVRYAYSGILEPINANGSSIFNSNKNSIIPVKFRLQDASSGFVTGAVAEINRTKISDNLSGTINEEVYTHEATPGNRFIYNSTTNEYVFNLATSELLVGTWRIEIRLDDGTSKYADISVK